MWDRLSPELAERDCSMPHLMCSIAIVQRRGRRVAREYMRSSRHSAAFAPAEKLFDLISGVYLRLLNTEFYPIYGINLRGIQKIDPMFGIDLLINAFLSGFMFMIDPVEKVEFHTSFRSINMFVTLPQFVNRNLRHWDTSF
jgi:hypothetical protein